MEEDKLRMQTPNIMEENFRKLAALFPSAVTETIGDDGKACRTVDVDVLRQLIDADVAEGREERYQFTWPEKAQSVLRACAPTRKTLRLDRSKSVGSDGTAGSIDTENIYIEGDNLEALKILQETYLGKVKMIYIDPPYNTGNDFIYRDDFSEDEDEYWEESGQLDEEGSRLVQNMESSGRFHTNWLNMIYPRLWLARDLLAQDGVIFISIDDNEAHNLRKCCDDIFGAGNFVGTYIKQSKVGGGSDSKFIVKEHEYCLVYARNINHTLEMFIAHDETYLQRYKEEDENGRFFWDTFARPGLRNPIHYDIVAPDGTVMNYGWIHSKKRYEQEVKDGTVRIVPKSDGGWSVQFKQYLNLKGKKPRSMTMEFGGSIDGKNDIISLFENDRMFSYPKSVKYIKTLLSTIGNKDALVLDFFSGSATTAHAVMQLNAEDGGHRRFIMIQLPEECAEGSEARKAGFANICEIGEERIRRAGRKIRGEMAGKADGLDIGFRVFYVDSSNMKDVWYAPEETVQDQLGSLVDNIKEDRAAEDLLFQAMLELGIELSADIAEEEIAGHRVFFVRDGALAACFDANIKEETLTEIAKRQPLFAVLRDSGLADDSAYVNFEQIFKAYSPGTRKKVI